MSRPAEIVLLCEDLQHKTFVYRFLKRHFRYGRELAHRLRVEIAPRGRGAADRYVVERYPHEVVAYRQQAGRRDTRLLVMIDGDSNGVEDRIKQLDDACRQEQIPCRRGDERIVMMIPTWNIETWLFWLAGNEADETKKNYPKLPKESDCQPGVDELVTMCRSGELRQPAPSSLVAACSEFNARYE